MAEENRMIEIMKKDNQEIINAFQNKEREAMQLQAHVEELQMKLKKKRVKSPPTGGSNQKEQFLERKVREAE